MLAPVVRNALIATAALAGCDRVFELEDLAVPDSRSFDATRDCPVSYESMFSQTSRYRIIDAFQTAWQHNDTCETDAPGLAHLAVIDSPGERTDLLSGLRASGDYRWYIGAVQQASATAPDAEWLWLNGSPFAPNLWAIAEPDDADGVEDRAEQFTMLQDGYSGLVDFIGNNSQQALCECDGRPITDDARAVLDAATGL